MGETNGLLEEACHRVLRRIAARLCDSAWVGGAVNAVADVAALLGDLPQVPQVLEPARVRWRALGREGQAAGANADDEVEQAGHQVVGGLLEGVALPGGEADQ